LFLMIHSFTLKALTVHTGDLLCTTDGGGDLLPGQFWRFIGRMLPGEVDHVIVYIGPGGRCVEAGARGVITFDAPAGAWEVVPLMSVRGPFVDSLYGAAYPLHGRDLAAGEEARLRTAIGAYCLAQVGKPYNINYLNPETDEAFYCSQLPYKAYQACGIDLNTGRAVEDLPGSAKIIFPHEIWDGCPHQRVQDT
jgi:hypothetical protein